MRQRILLSSAAQEIPLQYTTHYAIYSSLQRVPNPSQIITPHVNAFPCNIILYMIMTSYFIKHRKKLTTH